MSKGNPYAFKNLPRTPKAEQVRKQITVYVTAGEYKYLNKMRTGKRSLAKMVREVLRQTLLADYEPPKSRRKVTAVDD